MKYSVKHLVLALLVAIAIPLQRVDAEDLIKVGVMLHLGGDFAAWGHAYLEGINLAEDEVNAGGGIKGKKVALVVQDSRFDPRITASVSKILIDVDHVPVAIISTFTEVQVAGPIFERAKVPLVVIGDSDEEIDKMGNFVFSTGSWVKGYAVSASQFMRDRLKLDKVAVLATNNPWSQTTANTFKEDFEKRGGSVVYRGDLNPQETDFRTLFLKLKAQKIEGIFAPLTANSIPFFKQARENDLSMPIITAGAALDNDVIAAAAQMVEGRYVTDAYLDPARPEASKLLRLYQKKYGKAPAYPSVTGRGYDGFLTIVHALQNSDGFSSEAIKNALYKVDFEGAGFHVHMSPEGGARLPVEVLEVKNGRLEKQ